MPLGRNGGVQATVFDTPRHLRESVLEGGVCQFITPESLDSNELIYLWDKVALGPNEGLIL